MNNHLAKLQERLKIAQGRDKIEILTSIFSIELSQSPPKALEIGLQILDLAKQENHKDLQCIAQKNIGTAYSMLCDYPRALEYYLASLQISEELNDKVMMGKIFNNIGIVYKTMGNYDSSLEYYLQSLRLKQEQDNPSGIAYSLNNIGEIYTYLSEWTSALSYYFKALNTLNILDDKSGIATVNYNIGIVYKKLSRYDEALVYLFNSLEFFRELGDQFGLAYSLNTIGEIYSFLQQYDEALQYYSEAIKIREKLKDKSGIAMGLIDAGAIYTQLSNFDKALEYLDRALTIAQEINSKQLLQNCYEKLVEFYSRKGSSELTLKYFRHYADVRSELFNKEKSEKLAELETIYQIEKKKRKAEIYRLKNIELAKANKVIEFKNNQLEAMNKKLRSSEENLQKAVDTKNKFFSILAHDLRNPIQGFLNVSYLLEYNFDKLSPMEVHGYIQYIRQSSEYLSYLVENVLEWSRSQTGQMEFFPEEFDLYALVQENIIFWENRTKEKNIELKVDISQKTTAYADPNMVSAVIRNLLSNAIKFTPNGGEIYITSQKTDEIIQISVADRGIGITEEKARAIFRNDETIQSTEGTEGEKGTGLGLVLCKEFVEKNGGKIWVKSIFGQGSTFQFTLPTKSKNKHEENF